MMLLVPLLTFTRTTALVPLTSFRNPVQHRAFSLHPHHRLSSSSSVTTTSLKLEKSRHNKNNNQLLDLPSPILRHQYSILRHGQSLANVDGIISSDPNIATKQHGLSNLGQNQVQNTAVQFAEQFNPDKYQGVMIVSSDFKRAYETAFTLSETLSLANIPLYKNQNGLIVTTDVRLRERNFGELNGGSDMRYQDVWDIDVTDPNHTEFGVECVNSVLRRTTGLVLELEEVLSGSTYTEEDGVVENDEEEGGVIVGNKPWRCVLVAHGDVLQILQTGFAKKVDGKDHRKMEHLETATMRDLSLAD